MKGTEMTIFRGHWEQMPENPNYISQEPTQYLRATAEVTADVRETMTVWTEYLSTTMNALADNIRYDDATKTKSQARNEAWAVIDDAVHAFQTPVSIGLDPRVYTTQQIVKVCVRELGALQKNGRPKDIKRSMVDRHNWQVVNWAYFKFGTEKFTEEQLDWIEDRVIDIQVNTVATETKSQRMLREMFA
jgi:hypothetical protein